MATTATVESATAGAEQTTPPPTADNVKATSDAAKENDEPKVTSTSGVNGATRLDGSRRKSALYKTIMCRSWAADKKCPYEYLCQFAHGEADIRLPPRLHPMRKTKPCRSFIRTGDCAYGDDCDFIHDPSMRQQMYIMPRTMFGTNAFGKFGNGGSGSFRGKQPLQQWSTLSSVWPHARMIPLFMADRQGNLVADEAYSSTLARQFVTANGHSVAKTEDGYYVIQVPNNRALFVPVIPPPMSAPSAHPVVATSDAVVYQQPQSLIQSNGVWYNGDMAAHQNTVYYPQQPVQSWYQPTGQPVPYQQAHNVYTTPAYQQGQQQQTTPPQTATPAQRQLAFGQTPSPPSINTQQQQRSVIPHRNSSAQQNAPTYANAVVTQPANEHNQEWQQSSGEHSCIGGGTTSMSPPSLLDCHPTNNRTRRRAAPVNQLYQH